MSSVIAVVLWGQVAGLDTRTLSLRAAELRQVLRRDRIQRAPKLDVHLVMDTDAALEGADLREPAARALSFNDRSLLWCYPGRSSWRKNRLGWLQP